MNQQLERVLLPSTTTQAFMVSSRHVGLGVLALSVSSLSVAKYSLLNFTKGCAAVSLTPSNQDPKPPIHECLSTLSNKGFDFCPGWGASNRIPTVLKTSFKRTSEAKKQM
jgi:hypothetical protein